MEKETTNMDSITNLTIGVAVLGVIVLLFIAATILIAIWIYFKLKQHQHDINILKDRIESGPHTESLSDDSSTCLQAPRLLGTKFKDRTSKQGHTWSRLHTAYRYRSGERSEGIRRPPVDYRLAVEKDSDTDDNDYNFDNDSSTFPKRHQAPGLLARRSSRLRDRQSERNRRRSSPITLEAAIFSRRFTINDDDDDGDEEKVQEVEEEGVYEYHNFHKDKIRTPSTMLKQPENPSFSQAQAHIAQSNSTSSPPHQQSTRPATIIIHKETANVYGKNQDISQVMMAAQSYYKESKETTEDVPVESMRMADSEIHAASRPSMLFTDDWITGSPTSFLIDGNTSSFHDVVSVNKGMFIHMTVGPDGGRLAVSGVVLDIPQGALDEPRLITAGIVWDELCKPNLTKKQTLLSPIVLCQPSGLSFNMPVSLSFPHAAVDILSDWSPQILQREGSLQEDSDWQNLAFTDGNESVIGDSRITLKLRHFTQYTAVGESQPGKAARKLAYLVAFTNKLEKTAFFTPRIYCLNRYKDIQEVSEMASSLKPPAPERVDDTQLIIEDNGRDISVEMTHLSYGWNLVGDEIEIMPFENVWHDFHPHCTFIMKPSNSGVSDIICEFQSYQNGSENKATKMKIAEIMARTTSPLSSAKDDPVEDLTRELIILLDPTNEAATDAGDWTTLAEKMGCSVTRIRWLGTQTSKTRLLIEKWQDDKRTFTELRDLLLEINRPDAARKVENRLHLLEPKPSIPEKPHENDLSGSGRLLNDLGNVTVISERTERCRSVKSSTQPLTRDDNMVDDDNENPTCRSAVENTNIPNERDTMV